MATTAFFAPPVSSEWSPWDQMQPQRITKTLTFIINRDGSARCPSAHSWRKNQRSCSPSCSKLLPPTATPILAWIVWCHEMWGHCCVVYSETVWNHIRWLAPHDLSANYAVRASSLIWARNSFALAIKAAQTRERLQKLSRADHRRCMATMAYIQLVQSLLVLVVHKSIAFEIGFRYLEGAIAVGCISFRHQLALPDCCMVQLRYIKKKYTNFLLHRICSNFASLLRDTHGLLHAMLISSSKMSCHGPFNSELKLLDCVMMK